MTCLSWVSAGGEPSPQPAALYACRCTALLTALKCRALSASQLINISSHLRLLFVCECSEEETRSEGTRERERGGEEQRRRSKKRREEFGWLPTCLSARLSLHHQPICPPPGCCLHLCSPKKKKPLIPFSQNDKVDPASAVDSPA